MDGDHRFPRLLRYRDVAEIIGVAPQTVREWVSTGKIPHIKLGTGRTASVRFDIEELQEWLKRWRKGGDAA
jgi:excisionase family DNA binding protein